VEGSWVISSTLTTNKLGAHREPPLLLVTTLRYLLNKSHKRCATAIKIRLFLI